MSIRSSTAWLNQMGKDRYMVDLRLLQNGQKRAFLGYRYVALRFFCTVGEVIPCVNEDCSHGLVMH